MKKFTAIFGLILLVSPVRSSYALWGQKEARAKAEARADRAETELKEVKQRAAAAQKKDQDDIQTMEFELAAVVVLALGGIWYFHTFRRTVVVRSPAHDIVTQFVVIDAANVVRSSQGEPPSLLRLIGLLMELEKQKYTYKCFFDANTMFVLEKSGLLDEANAYRALLRDFHDVFIEVPGKTRADDSILDYAHKHGTPIISNDRYRDYATKYPWIENSSNRRVSFKAHSGTVHLSSIGMEASVPNNLGHALDEYCTMLKTASVGRLQ